MGDIGDRALVSITSDVSDREWQYLCLRYGRHFQMLALHMHHTFLRLGGTAELPHLSPRELWIAEGKTVWEGTVILGLSEHTVRCYLENARH
jgi:DNA-binding CsgD family transcriptional regulator